MYHFANLKTYVMGWDSRMGYTLGTGVKLKLLTFEKRNQKFCPMMQLYEYGKQGHFSGPMSF